MAVLIASLHVAITVVSLILCVECSLVTCVLIAVSSFIVCVDCGFDAGINWQLIFGEEIAGAGDLSVAAIARVCGGGLLLLCACVSLFVQGVVEYAAAAEAGGRLLDSSGVYVWPQAASAAIVGLPVLLLLLPLPLLAWRTRVAWLLLGCKMLAVPFVEVHRKTPKLNPECFKNIQQKPEP